MTDPETNLDLQPRTNLGDARLYEALDKILSSAPELPKALLEQLCKIWLEFSEASWAWLWIAHRDGNGIEQWEIIGSWDGVDNGGISAPIELHTGPNEGAVVHYALEIARPVYVNEIEAWKRCVDGKAYRVAGKEQLIERGAKKFLVVPLVFPSSEDQSVGTSPHAPSVLGAMSGAICLHYTEGTQKTSLYSEAEYMLLGKATANAISHSFAIEQRHLLSKMDLLAAKYLTLQNFQPETRRSEYLKEVTDLIKEHMSVSYVSFFYQTEDGDEIECIATTGLGSDSRERPMENLSTARYKKGCHITGRVFASGKPFVCQSNVSGDKDDEKHLWCEIPFAEPHDQRVFVIWPICTPIDPDSPNERPKILGVIRCVANRARDGSKAVRYFDPIQLQTLAIIADRLAPILDTMDSGIRRNRSVSIIKHDLYAPLRVIEDQAILFRRHQDGEHVRLSYLSENILGAVLLAKNLVGALSEQRAFKPELLFLERDIIARLRDGLNRFAWVENRMRITYDGLRAIPKLWVDQDLIERAICNLLINAIKYGHSETDIHVEGVVLPDAYALRIKNHGIGIDPCEAQRIFEGTYRSRAAMDRTIGLGHGLKIARSAMQRHGGDLRLEQGSNPTIFTMLFPKQVSAVHSASHFTEI